MSLKKICLVIPSLHPGGMERVMSELAGYFCQQPDTEIHLVMYGMKPETFYSLPQNLVIHQPDWIFDNTKRKWNTIKRAIYLRSTIKKIKPHSILSFGEYWNSFVLIALLGLKYPIFVSDRCQPNKKMGFIHDHLRKWLYPKATGIITQTNIAKDIYSKQFQRSNIKVIGNPIRQIKSNSEEIERENIVLSVGRLIASKNHDLLIDIFIRIGMPDWKLVIVGGDAIRQNGMERLTAKIKKKHAEDKVILTGNISNVENYYLKSKIFAFTSSSEGFPNVIGEAMSAGLPVIAFDCVAGPAEMIEDNHNGFLIPTCNEIEFENRLICLMKDAKLREKFINNAFHSVQKFSLATVGQKFYNELVDII